MPKPRDVLIRMHFAEVGYWYILDKPPRHDDTGQIQKAELVLFCLTF